MHLLRIDAGEVDIHPHIRLEYFVGDVPPYAILSR
jgi:hypothetical protein